jgi:lipid-binding SYLF domain-containing protein
MKAKAWNCTAALALILAKPVLADDPVHEAREAIQAFEKADPGISKFFHGSAGYVVFPTVGKGAIGVGGAHGSGILFEQGQPVGKATLTQVTIGLQLGGESYSEVVFLETAATVKDFKKGNFELAAQASAMAAAAGASANAKYKQGVAVFTVAKGGLMYEASVGGQKFGYEPLAKKK